MKKLIVIFCLAFLFTMMASGSVISLDLVKKMEAQPNQQLHIIVFFTEKLEPKKAISDFAITGDRIGTIKQVIAAYQRTSQRQFFWLSQFCQMKSHLSEISNLHLHALVQAASLKATPSIIREIARCPEIRKIVKFSHQLLKPNKFFLVPEYFQIQRETIIRTGQEQVEPVRSSVKMSREGSIDPEKVINILKKIFDFIKENHPVVDTSTDQASAVPKGIESWQSLAEWREKHSGQYTIKYTNGFGITVVKIVVRTHFYYNGNYNGVGKYITCATASIDELDVKWGYTLSATAKIPDSGIVNLGTSENPIAGMKMFIHWMVKTMVQHQEGTLTFSLDGQGNISAY